MNTLRHLSMLHNSSLMQCLVLHCPWCVLAQAVWLHRPTGKVRCYAVVYEHS